MSGYFLYQSSSLESFPGRFPELFLQETPLDPPVYTVVQNTGLGEWLVRYLAQLRTAVMGPRILMPEQALRKFAERYPTAKRILAIDDSPKRRGLLFMDGMKLTVFKALSEVLRDSDPVFAPLRQYLGDTRDGIGERLWQLADALAGIFYHYGMNCLPLVESWEQDRAYSGILSTDELSEAWQRRLWQRIFHKDAPYTHLSRVLSEIMDSGESCKPPASNPPARILLFGSMFLGETGLRFFRYLAGDFDVHHFLLTPSRAFCNVPGTGLGELFEQSGVTQPFLRDNGRLSAGFADLLPKLDTGPADEHWANPGEPGTLLHRLRGSFIDDAALKGPVTDDGSLAIHNVTGSRREVEILKDRILEALRNDDTLAPTQIGVLAPDISRFAPYIETVFPSHLTFNITDLPTRSEAPYPSAFRLLAELPGSRFGRGTLIRLFSNPCFSPTGRDSGLAAEWRLIVENLHIRWGVDSEHRLAEGAADGRTGSWETAFERLLAGYYFEEGDDTGILPAFLSGDGDADNAGKLMFVIRALDDELRDLNSRERSLKDWTLLWESIAGRWLKPRREGIESEDDERDRLRIKGAIRDLMALSEDVGELADFKDGTIPWTVFSSLLDEMTNPTGGRRGRYLARGITCASLKPMRAIPFRRIYILGMDEGAWPGREYLTGFDLRDRVPKSIDLSRESVDRFAFLEILFSASDHVSFFYTGRDPERGDPLSPAVPLAELCEHLGEGAEILTRRHPLNPFDPRALTGEGPLATSSPQALALAESLYRGLAKPSDYINPLPQKEAVESIDWRDLVRFLRNPVEHFYLRRIGAAREPNEGDTVEDDVLEAEFLDWWLWKNRHIAEAPETLRRPDLLVESFRERLRLEAAVADTPAGMLQAESWLEDAESLAAGLDRLIDDGLDIGEPFSCRFVSGNQLPPVLAEPRPGSIVNLPAPGLLLPDGGMQQITGTLDGLRLLRSGANTEAEVWTLLDFISGRRVNFKHMLRTWVAALMIAASLGEKGPKELRVFRLSGTELPAGRYRFGSGVLNNPSRILGSLVNIYSNGESAPLSLYPELADKLAAMDKKEPVGNRLAAAAAEAWNGIVTNTRATSSTVRDCYFRRRYLESPDFESENFRRAWEDLYRNGGIT